MVMVLVTLRPLPYIDDVADVDDADNAAASDCEEEAEEEVKVYPILPSYPFAPPLRLEPSLCLPACLSACLPCLPACLPAAIVCWPDRYLLPVPVPRILMPCHCFKVGKFWKVIRFFDSSVPPQWEWAIHTTHRQPPPRTGGVWVGGVEMEEVHK